MIKNALSCVQNSTAASIHLSLIISGSGGPAFHRQRGSFPTTINQSSMNDFGEKSDLVPIPNNKVTFKAESVLLRVTYLYNNCFSSFFPITMLTIFALS